MAHPRVLRVLLLHSHRRRRVQALDPRLQHQRLVLDNKRHRTLDSSSSNSSQTMDNNKRHRTLDNRVNNHRVNRDLERLLGWGLPQTPDSKWERVHPPEDDDCYVLSDGQNDNIAVILEHYP
jgi:hypothetical protein